MCGITNRSVEDMKAMTLWEFMKVREGWMLANGTSKSEKEAGGSSLTMDDFRAAMEMELEEHTEVFDPVAEAQAELDKKKKGRV